MRGMIAGCVCAGGAGFWALTGAGPDAEAIVHKPPEAVYSAVASAFANSEQSDVLPGKDGNSVAFQVMVEKEPGSRIESILLIGGEQAGSIEFTVSPTTDVKGAPATKLTGEVDVDTKVLQKHLGDGPNEDIGRIPEFAFDMAMKQAMVEMADKIENGVPLDSPSTSFAAMRANSRMQDSTSRHERDWAQQSQMREAVRPTQAAKPSMDPNAAARKYLDGR